MSELRDVVNVLLVALESATAGRPIATAILVLVSELNKSGGLLDKAVAVYHAAKGVS